MSKPEPLLSFEQRSDDKGKLSCQRDLSMKFAMPQTKSLCFLSMMNWSRKAGVRRKRRRELIFPLFPRWQNHKCTVLSLVCSCSYKKCGVIGKLHASPAPLNVFKQTTIIGRCFRLFCPQPQSHRPGYPASQNKDGGWNLAREVPKVH